jgi:hypothetical protein
MVSQMTEDDVTGTISAASSSPASLSHEAPPIPAPSAQDWPIARLALASALDPQGAGAMVSWENPASGARGAITPVGAIYVADGQTCRAFLADIGGKAPARRVQGRGCRDANGQWVVSDLKPFGA